MAKIIVSEFVSIDGVMDAPGGEPGYIHTGWVANFQDSAQIKYKLDEVLAHQALLLGRKTYESFAGAWPFMNGEFAEKMNSMPKYVVSTSMEKAEWNNSTTVQSNSPISESETVRLLAEDQPNFMQHSVISEWDCSFAGRQRVTVKFH